MEFLLIGVWFLFGTILGSFLNALSFRFGTGKSMWGRSQCFSCGATLRSFELIPILSYLLQKGRCRSCKAKIALQYPAVELLAGLLSVGVYLEVGDNPYLMALHLLVWQTLLFIGIYDLRHKIIPDSAVLLAGALALGSALLQGGLTLEGILMGPLLASPLLLVSLLSRGTYMGWGDGKLMFSLGWLLGYLGGFMALLFSFWIGALFAGVLLTMSLKGKSPHLTMKSEIPFAPFLLLGAALVYFTDADLLLATLFF